MPDVIMPQLGETVTEGTVTKWLKAEGDKVARDEPLFEVSTDKVDSEVPSPAAGVLTAILVEEGDTVDVGVALAVIDGDAGTGSGAPAPEVAAAAPAAAPAPTTSTAPEPVPAPVAARAPVPASAPTRSATPVTPVSPALSSLPDEPVPPSAVPPAPIPSPAAVAPTGSRLPSTPAAADQARLLSPVVRKLLAEHDLDPSTIRGTGLEGRITRADVEAVIEGGTPPAAVPSIAAQRPAPTRSPSSGAASTVTINGAAK